MNKDYHCVGDEACCTPSNLCGIGYGDCQSHNDCQAGLRCGSNNCVGQSFDSQDDCCAQPIIGWCKMIYFMNLTDKKLILL